MRSLLILGSLAFVSSAGAAGVPQHKWKLPEAEGRKWVARVTKAVARDNWAVDLRGNEIIVRRIRPVAMLRIGPNSPQGSKPRPDGERSIRFVLRFGPKMSMDEYDRLAAVNTASAKEYTRLHDAVRVTHKFGEFAATTPEERERVRAFHAAVAKRCPATPCRICTPLSTASRSFTPGTGGRRRPRRKSPPSVRTCKIG